MDSDIRSLVESGRMLSGSCSVGFHDFVMDAVRSSVGGRRSWIAVPRSYGASSGFVWVLSPDVRRPSVSDGVWFAGSWSGSRSPSVIRDSPDWFIGAGSHVLSFMDGFDRPLWSFSFPARMIHSSCLLSFEDARSFAFSDDMGGRRWGARSYGAVPVVDDSAFRPVARPDVLSPDADVPSYHVDYGHVVMGDVPAAWHRDAVPDSLPVPDSPDDLVYHPCDLYHGYSSYAGFILASGAHITDACSPRGHLSDLDIRYLHLLGSDSFRDCPSVGDSYPDMSDDSDALLVWDDFSDAGVRDYGDAWDDYDLSSYDAPDGDVDYPDADDNMYRPSHWIDGDVVSSVAPPCVRVIDGIRMAVPRPRPSSSLLSLLAHAAYHIPASLFVDRTRCGARAGLLTAPQEASLSDAFFLVDAVRPLGAGVYALSSLLGSRVSPRIPPFLASLGYDVRKVTPAGGHRPVWGIVVSPSD